MPARIPDDLVRLYQIINLNLPVETATDQSCFAALLACGHTTKHLIVGANSLYRFYLSQMFREVRSAVEAVAIARLIIADPMVYEIFRQDREIVAIGLRPCD